VSEPPVLGFRPAGAYRGLVTVYARLSGLVRISAVVAACGVALVSAPAAHAAEPPYHPSRLAHVGSAGQVIVVTAPSWSSSRGTVRAYERDGEGGWREVVSATTAELGWSGMYKAAQRRQGTGKTPAGTFAIPRAFGRLADPGTALPYRRFDRNDAWTYSPDNPRTYNVFQTADRSWDSYGTDVEELWSFGSQYRYVAVLDYNLPGGPIRTGPDGIRRSTTPADTKAGGGIFLHVSNGTSTAGCIAIPEPVMRHVLRWLDPKRDPVIVIGPESAITRM
jgi:L,D-peptidoglycan transpeptidase YkuD (ErfK/YbiS/YcfS/YnhG family)